MLTRVIRRSRRRCDSFLPQLQRCITRNVSSQPPLFSSKPAYLRLPRNSSSFSCVQLSQRVFSSTPSDANDLNNMGEKELLSFMHSATIDLLRRIPHPQRRDADIVYLGLIRNILVRPHKFMQKSETHAADSSNNNKKVNISIELELSESYREIKELIKTSLQSDEVNPYASIIASVRVNMAPAATDQTEAQRGGDAQNTQNNSNNTQNSSNGGKNRSSGLASVKNVIAVSSCKGGVGKSTVAVNLAYALRNLDYKVGIFDSDIFGPSLPTMISVSDTTVRQDVASNLLIPLTYEGVKVMSFGYVKTGAAGSDSRTGLAAMRGPIVTQVVSQLLLGTFWGDLDYLIIDMPPGTGDIHITLSQQVAIDAAVVVSTPSKLSFIDVIKGIAMFDKVKVPTIAAVENMTHFVCKSCGDINSPFGPGYQRQLIDTYGIKNAFKLPISPNLSWANDTGDPLMLQNPDNDPKSGESLKSVQDVFYGVAKGCVDEIEILNDEEQQLGKHPKFAIDNSAQKIMFSWGKDGSAEVIYVSYEDLRMACPCAACIDEYTQEVLVRKEHLGDLSKLKINVIQECGNYAVAVEWGGTHKHESIYSFERVRQLFGQK